MLQRVPTMSLDTVFRTLSTLTERGLVARISFTPGPAGYDADPARHHHVWMRCSLVRYVHDEQLDSIEPTDEVVDIGRPETVTMQFRSVCRDCQRKGSGA